MRRLAIILLAIGVIALGLFADLNIWPILPLHLGSPGSALSASNIALFGGLAATIGATVLAFCNFWAARQATSSRLLLAFCLLLLVGFALMFKF
jgi:hypothetical protein